MANLINKTDSLNAGREKINASITNAESALAAAIEAVASAAAANATADAAKTTSDQTRTEFNVITNNDTSGLGGQLSVGSDGTTVHPDAQTRLSSEHNTLKSKVDKSIGQKFSLDITTITDTTINALTQRKD